MSKVLQFLREVRAEFNNITWPKKDALIQLTVVVISISIIISLILGGFDYLFTSSFTLFTKSTNQLKPPANIPENTIQISPAASSSALPSTILTPTIKKLKK